MAIIINWKNYLIINLLGISLLYFASLPIIISSIIGFGLITLSCFVLGQIFHRRLNISLSTLLGLIYFITYLSVFGFIGIFLQSFTALYCWLVFGLLNLILTFYLIKKPLAFNLTLPVLPRPKNLLITIGYILFSFIAWQQLFNNGTTDAINTPWQIVPNLFFIAYFLATACLFFILRFNKEKNLTWSLIGLSIHFFLSTCVAIFIYKLGADYDPFIHRANVDIILQSGTLLPTPIYYLSQYAIIIFTHTLTNLPTNLIDIYLVPVLSAIILPTLLVNLGLAFKLKNRNLITIAVLSLFIVPLKTFTVTTPQALANLLALTALILVILAISKKISLWSAWFAVISSLLTHLIAGLPIAIILAYFSIDQLNFFKHWPDKLKQFLKLEFLILTIIILPIAFLVNAQKTASELKVAVIDQPWQKFFDIIYNWQNFKLYNYISIHDFIYNFANWRWLIVLTIIMAGYFVLRNINYSNIFKKLITGFICLVIASIILSMSVDFFSLANAERNIYPARLIELAIYCLVPLIFFGGYGIWHKLFEQSRSLELISVFILVSAISVNLYLSYPRVDRISENHGYSTSQTDIDTVKFIEKISYDDDYVVLASQPVSAAAISTLGYAHYYNSYFYYPVPTGGRMYELFENLAYNHGKPSEIINTVRYLTNVKTVYFVLNRYWSGADESIIFYKNTADAWYAIDDKNFIFVYKNSEVIDTMADKRLQEINK